SRPVMLGRGARLFSIIHSSTINAEIQRVCSFTVQCERIIQIYRSRIVIPLPPDIREPLMKRSWRVAATALVVTVLQADQVWAQRPAMRTGGGAVGFRSGPSATPNLAASMPRGHFAARMNSGLSIGPGPGHHRPAMHVTGVRGGVWGPWAKRGPWTP